MSEEFKNQLDTFIRNIIIKVDKKEIIPEIQQEYDQLMEIYSNLAILPMEEFESLDKAMNDYDILVKDMKTQLQTAKAQKEADEDKIKSLMKEVSNNIELNERYKELNKEYNELKQKYNCCYNENVGYQMKIKNDEKTINDYKENISDLRKENFEKFERLNNLEKVSKLNEIKLNQTLDQLSKYSIENNELKKNYEDLKTIATDKEKIFRNQLNVLERQVKTLSEANSNFVQENNEVQNQLKDFQIYTNMAKVNTKKLNKNDFSILETMSKRAECAELEVQKLLTYIEELKSVNEKLRNKIKPLEEYALLQIKHDHEINVGNDTTYELKNKVFTQEEMTEINNLKNQPNELLSALIVLKAENLELHNQLKDITIECNQQLREAKLKKDK